LLVRVATGVSGVGSCDVIFVSVCAFPTIWKVVMLMDTSAGDGGLTVLF